MKGRYRAYLVRRGYKELTPSGLKSTVYSYETAIGRICKLEGLGWLELAVAIDRIAPEYECDGRRAAEGAKSNNTIRNAVRRFREFCQAKQEDER